MMKEVEITSELKQYWPELTRYARKYVGRFGAELDDLVQEGAIFVWQSLQKGITPSEDHIRNRMRNWVRTLEFQSRYGRIKEPVEHPAADVRTIGGLDIVPSEDN
jgi:DNA-directed RNA polymerase specialized sigma24 family protein